MSYVFNMVGGGSGSGGPSASDAILTVTVPTGSTVTMTKGGVTLTPTMWVQAADPTLDCALFVISPSLFDAQNPWTVTATLGTNTASDTVTISTNKQYDIVLSYRVPAEYQEVEYIEGTGTQYINTGIPASTSNLRISSTVMLTGVGTTSGSGGDAIWAGGWSVDGYLLIRFGSNPGVFRWHSGGKSVDASATLHTWFEIETTKDSLIVDGTTYWLSSPSGSDQNYTVCLWWASNTGGANPAEKARIRLKPTKMYSGNTLLREFYPAYRKSDSVAGLWDGVEKQFHTNDGTGAFVVGPDVN